MTMLNAAGSTVPVAPNTITDATPPEAPSAPVAPSPKRKSPLILVGIVLVIAGLIAGVAYAVRHTAKPQATIRPYFTYTAQDTAKLRGLKSSEVMTARDIQTWQDKAYDLVEQHATIDVDSSKVYAYLAVAQMDAAALSYQAHHAYNGSVAVVSKDVLCQFYNDSCSDLLAAGSDDYSRTLSALVLAKITERMAADKAQTKPYTLKTGPGYWTGPAPQIGLSAGSFKPWLVKSSSQFRAAPPPPAGSAEQIQQLATVKQTLASATNEQRAIVVKWAGGPGTRTPPGIWLTLADDYMQQKQTSFDTYIETRALVTMSMADAVSSVFDSKYTYQYKRPNMFDTSIVTIMPTPNHPSYPAGHATISWAAATVLTHYLPANQQEWERLAKEATDSRTIGGIHFPMDNAAGTTLGKNVGKEVIKNW
ncbi:MAG TPA: phosphatase PAP2 family protein [Patescibacteria group bacterium]|nr:phosphatase PAP2 family protein [Patescibacteria group bacterium]